VGICQDFLNKQLEDIMAKFTREDIIKLAEESNVRYLRLQFSDILGTIKNVEVPKRRGTHQPVRESTRQ